MDFKVEVQWRASFCIINCWILLQPWSDVPPPGLQMSWRQLEPLSDPWIATMMIPWQLPGYSSFLLCPRRSSPEGTSWTVSPWALFLENWSRVCLSNLQLFPELNIVFCFNRVVSVYPNWTLTDTISVLIISFKICYYYGKKKLLLYLGWNIHFFPSLANKYLSIIFKYTLIQMFIHLGKLLTLVCNYTHKITLMSMIYIV